MDHGHGNDVRSVLFIEVIQIGNVLEVVGVDFSAFHNVIGLNVIGEFLDFQRNVLGSQDFLCHC